jgi:hypothetical protein
MTQTQESELRARKQLSDLKRQRNKLVEQINRLEKSRRRTPSQPRKKKVLSEAQQAGVKDRRSFIAFCVTRNQLWRSEHPRYLLEYLRETANTKSGCVVLFKDADTINIGWSKCNTDAEEFDRDIALYKAIRKARPLSHYKKLEREDPTTGGRVVMYKVEIGQNDWVPHSLTPIIDKFLASAEKFFRPKQQIQPQVATTQG